MRRWVLRIGAATAAAVGLAVPSATAGRSAALPPVTIGSVSGYVASDSHYSYYPLSLYAALTGDLPTSSGGTARFYAYLRARVYRVDGYRLDSDVLSGSFSVSKTPNGPGVGAGCTGWGGSALSPRGGYTILPVLFQDYPEGAVVTAFCSSPLTGPIVIRFVIAAPPALIAVDPSLYPLVNTRTGPYIATRGS